MCDVRHLQENELGEEYNESVLLHSRANIHNALQYFTRSGECGYRANDLRCFIFPTSP